MQIKNRSRRRSRRWQLGITRTRTKTILRQRRSNLLRSQTRMRPSVILRRGGCTTNWERRGSSNRHKVALNSSRVTIRICSKTSSHSKVVGQPKVRVRLEDKVALISDQCLEVVVMPSSRSSMCSLEVKVDRKEEVPAKDSKVKDSSSNHHHRNHQHPNRRTYSKRPLSL